MVVDGVVKLAPGAAVKIVAETKPDAAPTPAAPVEPAAPRKPIGVIGGQKK